ncbi:hypothetical protein FOPE_07140 [Fonsecaea pedrosoi]|nr:hypothetical protein FOPE_07140 [Fonsecaea pedrosoi]
MSLSFGLGDIDTAIKWTKTLAKALREAGGSRAEYQHLIRRLDILQSTLNLIADRSRGLPREDRKGLKKALGHCKKSLGAFNKGI